MKSWAFSGRPLQLAAAAFVLSGCMGGLPPAPRSDPVATSTAEEISGLIQLVNRHRRQVGCREFIWIDTVARVAQAHSDDMVRRNFFSHINPDGRTPFDRLRNAGVVYSKAAENIASGQATSEQVLQSWLASPGHRRNLEDCELRAHGIGFARGSRPLPYGTIFNAWTHVFVATR